MVKESENVTDNNNIEKNINENNEMKNTQDEKRGFNWGALVVPVIIAIVIFAFLCVAFYNKAILPKKQINKEVGYVPEEYVMPGQIEGLDYEITQEMFDESLADYNVYYDTVDRAAKETDQVDFNYTAMIDGKKDANISEKDAVITIGEDEGNVYEKFSNAMIGLKSGQKTEITITAEEATFLSENSTEYKNDVTMTLKVTSVSEKIVEELTDEYVLENYGEDGFTCVKDVYDVIEEDLIEEAEVMLWEQAVNNATLTGYPDSLYEEIVIEFTQDANANAEYWGMTTDEYLYGFEGYTDATLEEAYLYEVKAELLMWSLVKDLGLKTTAEEIESQYEYYCYDLGYETVEEMKEVYTKKEMRESVLLDKVHEYIYDKSNIKISYKLPQ